MANYFLDGSKLIYHLPKVQKWLEGKPVYPIHVEVSPSSGCNHRCILCCVDYKKHKFENLPKEIMLRLVDDFKEVDVKSFLLAGEGEPLLNRYCVDMLQNAKEAGIDGALTTNGVLFTPDVVDKALPNLTWMRFSIQSPIREDYAKIHNTNESDFNKVIENIKYAVKVKKENKLNVAIGIQQILIKENYNVVLENARLAKELGVDYFTIKRFSKHPGNMYDVPEDLHTKSAQQFRDAEKLATRDFAVIIRWNQFVNQPRTYTNCMGLPFITQILANGFVYPCCQFFDNPKFAYGNLKEHTLKHIFDSTHTRNTMKFIEDKYDINKCMSYCRHHSTNIFLDEISTKPDHVNFI